MGLVVFAGSALFATGHFHSVDEAAMFVAAANVIHEGSPHTNQMGYSLWALRPGEAVTMLNSHGDIYTKKSPLVSALMIPFLLLGRLAPGLNMVQAALLLGPLLTAMTAVLLYGFGRQLAYTRLAATLAALLFGFATMALPYAQTVFSELLASLGLLLSVCAVWRCLRPQTGPMPGQRGSEFLCGLGLALAIGSNAAYLLVVPLFAVAVLWPVAPTARRLSRLLRFGIPIGAIGIALLLYNYARFGAWLETGYHFAPGQEGFTTPLWWGALGLTVSPARGFLWYNPLAWLALFSWPQFHRLHPVLSRLVLLLVALHLIIFAAWWEWWGGYAWGPRFLLPLAPYVALISLPLLEAAVQKHRLVHAGMALIVLLSITVQVGGAAVDFNVYEETLDRLWPAPGDQPLRYHHHPSLVYDVKQSPVLYHWRQLRDGPYRPAGRQAQARRLSAVPALIRQQQQPGDSLIFLEPALLYELLEQPDLPLAYGLPYNVPATDSQARLLFERALRQAERVWLLTWYGPGDPGNWYEAQLRQEWASVSETWADDLRLVLLARPPQPEARPTEATVFGPIQLGGYSLQQQEGTLFLEVVWQATAPLTQDYVVFVHVLDADLNLVAQQDRPPLGGYRPTTSWQVGERVTDRFAFPLAAGQLAQARVVVGWYERPSLQRLPVYNQWGEPVVENRFFLPDPK